MQKNKPKHKAWVQWPSLGINEDEIPQFYKEKVKRFFEISISIYLGQKWNGLRSKDLGIYFQKSYPNKNRISLRS